MNNKIQGATLIYSTLVIIVILLVFISIYFNSEATQFQGIADSTETVINSESSVEIQKILVIEGEKVNEGEKLAELVNPELSLRISDINKQLLQLVSEKGMGKAEIKSKLIQVQAQQQAAVNDLNAQIRSLENQLKINKELSSGLKSFKIKNGNADDLKNPIILQIESLKQEIEDKKKEFQASAQMYRDMLVNSDTPTKIQMERLKEELEMLTEKSNNLAIYAPFEGIIGSVYFKGGEKVAPFTPILSINQKEPSVVKGYIHESFYSEIETGDKVTVVSIDGKKKVTGEVLGLGNRIIPYPVRLLKIPSFQLWGREITVKIPENNGLILGEKVTIVFKKSGFGALFSKIVASCKPTSLNAKDSPLLDNIREITWKGPVQIEASGAVFIEEQKLFAVVSDETEKKEPMLFLVDMTGNVKKALKIKGIETINDIESICRAGENEFVVASSLSHSKKGELKENRRILATVKITGNEAAMVSWLDFYSVLENLAKSGEGKLPNFISYALSSKTLDIEGLGVRNNTLFVAFKNPLMDKKPFIMKIENFRVMFDSKTVNPAFATFFTMNNVPENERISDLFVTNNELFFTTSCNSGKCGGFYKSIDNKGVLIKHFNDMKPEGIARDNSGTFFIFFDEGGHKSSKFTEIKK